MCKSRLNYEITGSGDPLLLLHGMFGSSQDWQNLASQLRNSYQLIIPDLPGFGKSKDSDKFLITEVFEYQHMLEPIVELLDSLSISNCAWVGYSLGGRIALYAAATKPTYISKLYLLGAGPGIQDPAERAERFKVDQERANKIRSLGLEAFFDRWYQAGLFKSLYDNKELYEPLLKRRISENDVEWAAHLLEQLSPGRVENLWPTVEALTIPCTYIIGELDQKYMQLLERIEAANQSIRVEIVKSASHSLHIEQPQALAEIIKAQ